MPLPSNNTQWPPARASLALEHMAEWSAWYSGDPDTLSGYYQSANGTQPRTRDAQVSGGVRGKVARWWWGTPTPANEVRAKLHVPLAADICGTSADLLFSESVNLTGGKSQTLQDFLDAQQDNGLDAELHQAAEVTAALGGGYLRVVWDKNINSVPWTDTVHADMAVPTFRWGRLAEVTFWQRLPHLGDDKVCWRLLEHHSAGRIEHALYRGTSDNLGTLVPLEDHPDSAPLALIVDALGGVNTGTTRLTATYIPNMLPNRLHRGSHQGRSDLQGVTPMLDALDEAYSSWWRDIRHAKSRLHVPRSYIESVDGPGSAGMADVDREVYVPLDGILATGKDGLLIDAQQLKIRVEEHKATCEAWTKTIIESAGYSTQSLSSDTGGAVTAAEVHSHERRSYMTRGKKIRYWKAAVRDHLITMAEVANANLGARVLLDQDMSVDFPDGVQDSELSLANTVLAMRNAEAASVETRVRILNPDWDDTAVTAEAAKIMAESGAGEPVPVPNDAGF